MEKEDALEALLVAQVLTLAKTLELLNLATGKKVSTDYVREAAKLIDREAPQVLQRLAETRASGG